MLSRSSLGLVLGSCAATSSFLALVLVASALQPEHIHSTHITEDELTERLQDDSLEPDQVFRYIDECSAKRDIILNGVSALELLGLDNISALSCEHNVVSARLATCTTVNDNAGFESVRNYCGDRLAKLRSECTKRVGQPSKKGFLNLKSQYLDPSRNFVTLAGHSLKQFLL